MPPLATRLRELALELGFDLVRFGPAEVAGDDARFLHWIDQGRHGEMGWLERQKARIAAPARVLPGARTTLALGLDYGRPPGQLPGGGRIARYAMGRDYHRVFEARMARLTRALSAEGLGRDRWRAGVDAVPILERALAVRAGIGFLAKSSGVIHPQQGPWLLLGEVLLAQELDTDGPVTGSCGSCRACLDACPTGAIVAPFELDARRCLSYTTIELRGPIPVELRAPQGEWLFGCDVCIEVCPFVRFGRAARPEAPLPEDLRPHPLTERYQLVQLLEISPEEWDREFRGTAIRRAQRAGLRRNAAVVLGNLGDERGRAPLARALRDQDPVLRGHAAWALGRLHARAELDQALRVEADPTVQAEIRHALGG